MRKYLLLFAVLILLSLAGCQIASGKRALDLIPPSTPDFFLISKRSFESHKYPGEQETAIGRYGPEVPVAEEAGGLLLVIVRFQDISSCGYYAEWLMRGTEKRKAPEEILEYVWVNGYKTLYLEDPREQKTYFAVQRGEFVVMIQISWGERTPRRELGLNFLRKVLELY